MKLFSPTTLFLVGAMFFLFGCGILPTPTPTPTATPLPTQTPTAVPTNTATPRPSPTATKTNALPPALTFALNKTQRALSMNFDFATRFIATQNDTKSEQPGLAIQGQDSTLNRHVKVSGLASDTNELITYELIVSGDNAYVKGLTGVPGIDPALWYVLPAELQAGVRRLPTASGLLSSFTLDDFAAAKFQAAGSETFDEQTCTIWTAQNKTTIQKIIGINDSETLKQQLGEIDQTELKVWTCADGYIHLIRGQVRGHNAAKPNDTVSIELYFQMNQFDQAFSIQEPPDALPFAPEQDTNAGTPTPEKTPAPGTQPTPTLRATPSPTP